MQRLSGCAKSSHTASGATEAFPYCAVSFFFFFLILLQVTDYLHCIYSPGHRIYKHQCDSAGASLGLFTDLGPDGLCLPTPGRYRRQEVNDCACIEKAV